MEKPTGNQCRRTRQTLFSEEVPEWVRSCLDKRCLSAERLCERRYPVQPPASAAQPLPDINSIFLCVCLIIIAGCLCCKKKGRKSGGKYMRGRHYMVSAH